MSPEEPWTFPIEYIDTNGHADGRREARPAVRGQTSHSAASGAVFVTCSGGRLGEHVQRRVGRLSVVTFDDGTPPAVLSAGKPRARGSIHTEYRTTGDPAPGQRAIVGEHFTVTWVLNCPDRSCAQRVRFRNEHLAAVLARLQDKSVNQVSLAGLARVVAA